MFVSRKRFEELKADYEYETKELRIKYWDLISSIARIHDYLKLNEVYLPAQTILKPKDGPERSVTE